MLSTKRRPPVPREQYKRASDRFDTDMPLEIDGTSGIARNISATGVYFETDLSREPGSVVSLSIEVTMGGEKLKLVCEGQVVRVDSKRGGKVGIAARLQNSFFSNPADLIDPSVQDTAPAALETVPASLDTVPASLDTLPATLLRR